MSETPNESPPPHASDPDDGGMNPAIKIAIVFSLLGAALLFLAFSSAGDVATYSATVAEVQNGTVTAGSRMLRVEGDLQHGSIQFREEPCEWRFTIERDGASMPVQFPRCVVPDTFRDDYDIEVVVEGRMDGDHFLADNIIPRCPSKYEEQARSQGPRG